MSHYHKQRHRDRKANQIIAVVIISVLILAISFTIFLTFFTPHDHTMLQESHNSHIND